MAMTSSISVLIVDDHPALRAGLTGLLEQEPGFGPVVAVGSELEMVDVLRQRRPDVVILDYALGRSDGLSACFRIKQRRHPPRVVFYSAYVDQVFAVPAAVAQADAIVSKSAPVERLLSAVRAAAAGVPQLAQPDPEMIEAASSRLRADDLPVLGMLFARVSVQDIADTLGTTAGDVRNRALRIIGEMQSADRIGEPVAS
jgi:DNA-binding NarL/FixJ family response regulator